MLLWPEEHILFASQDAVSEFLVLRDLNLELQEKNNLYLFISFSFEFFLRFARNQFQIC